jgi:hypothetical protein
MSTCRSCEAEILWASTCTGKPMPVNAMPCDDGNLVLQGEPPNRVALQRLPMDVGPFYASHFATCPNAEQHRKAKR